MGQHSELPGREQEVQRLPLTGITLEASRFPLYLVWGLALATGLLIPVLMAVKPGVDSVFPYVLTVGLIPLFLLLLSVPIKRLTRSRLRVYNDHLALENADGKKFGESFETLRWSKTAFIVGDRSIIWNNGKNQGLFPIKEFRTHVLPRLKPENRLSEWEMFRFQLGHMPRWIKSTLLLLLVGPPILIGLTAIALIYLGN